MTENKQFGISEQLNDLISRQAAIDAIMCEPTDAHYPSWYAERLKHLPSVQPEPRRGEKMSEQRLIDANALMELYADRLTVVAERYSPDSSECGILSGAMKLLEIQPTIEERKKVNRMSDLISRQAAIEVIEAGRLTKLIEAEVAVNGLKALPPAQPEIMHCKDCRHNHNCDIQYHAQAGAERRTE